MAGLKEPMDTVREETLDVDFERTDGTGSDRRERCVGEPFEMFSDAEAGEEEAGEGPRFVSRLVPLEELDGGASSGSGAVEQPRIREGWLTAKMKEIAEAKSKLVRLDDAYNQKRRALNRQLEDFEHLAEVKRALTVKVRDLTDQVTIARRLRHISAELCGGGDLENDDRKVPKPPATPPPERLREAALIAAGRNAAIWSAEGARDMEQVAKRRTGQGPGPSLEDVDKSKNPAGAPTLLASVTRAPPPPARWSPRRGAWVSVEREMRDPIEEERKQLYAQQESRDPWRIQNPKSPGGTQPKSKALCTQVEQAPKQRKRAFDADESLDLLRKDE